MGVRIDSEVEPGIMDSVDAMTSGSVGGGVKIDTMLSSLRESLEKNNPHNRAMITAMSSKMKSNRTLFFLSVTAREVSGFESLLS